MRSKYLSNIVRVCAGLAVYSSAAVVTASLRAGVAHPDLAPAAAGEASAMVEGTTLPSPPHALLVDAADNDGLAISSLALPVTPKADASPHEAAAVPPEMTAMPAPAAARQAQAPAEKDRAELPGNRIAQIRRALRLRPDQEPFWQPVAAILSEIERQRLAHREPAQPGTSAEARIDSEKLQRLASAAFPLIMSLDETQRREARALARSMGLASVASAI